MSSVRRNFRAFVSRIKANQKGNVLLMTAAAVPVILGSAGIGTDVVQWMNWKRQLQQAADSSALAGALAIAQSSDDWKSVAASDLAYNADIVPKAFSFTTPTTGEYAGNPNAVLANLSFQRNLPFSGMFLNSAPVIRTSAIAAVLANGTNCILALSNKDVTGIDGTGGSVDMGCGAAANATSQSAIKTDSGFNASPLSAVGNIEGTPPSGTEMFPYSVPQADPFASLPVVTVPSPCNKNTNGNGNASTVKLNEGCYSSFKLTGNKNYELQGGVYTINDDLEIAGTASLTTKAGQTAVLLLAKNRNIKITGNPLIQLTPMTSGTYKGVAIYQSRDSLPSTQVNDNKITGSSGSKFEGAIYMPKQHVTFTGNAGVDSNCMQIVADQVSFKGSVDISNTCPAGSGAQAFSGTVVRLVG